jgi:hypothetical protein
MAHTDPRYSSVLSIMQEEEESGDSGDDRQTQIFVHPNGESVQFAFYGLSEGQQAHLTHQIEVQYFSFYCSAMLRLST